MKSLAITHPGLELFAAKEIKELLGKNAKNIKTEPSVVFFEAKEYLDLCLLCYKAQSLIKVLLLLDSFSFDSQQEMSSRAESIAKSKELLDFIGKKTAFMVKCVRIGSHEFNSTEIEREIGRHIEGVVDLASPEVIVYAYIYNNRCHIGIDFSGFDLSKRQYRIFTHKDSLKATVAYSLLKIAGYKKNDFLLDPFCGSGTIPIEAALYACNFPVNHYNKDKLMFQNFNFLKNIDFRRFFEKADKKINLREKTKIYGYDSMLGYVKAAQKNAKIAGINKKVSLTRADIEWLDTKIDKNKVDKIVTNMPEVTERNKKTMEKIYREFFHQSDFILKKNGKIAIIANSPGLIEKYSEEYKFKIKKILKAMQGMKELDIFIIEK